MKSEFTDVIWGGFVKGRPVLDVFIGKCELLQSRETGGDARKMVHPIKARAMICTDRLVTTVSIDLLNRLHTVPNVARGGRSQVNTDHGYCLSLVLCSLTEERMVFKKVLAAAHAARSEDAPVMIGMDLLRKLTLHLEGPAEGFSLERR